MGVKTRAGSVPSREEVFSRKDAKAQRKAAKSATWSPAGFASLRLCVRKPYLAPYQFSGVEFFVDSVV